MWNCGQLRRPGHNIYILYKAIIGTLVPCVSFQFLTKFFLGTTCVIWMLRYSLQLFLLSSCLIHRWCHLPSHSKLWMRDTCGVAVIEALIWLLNTAFSWAGCLPRASLTGSATLGVRFHIQYKLLVHSHTSKDALMMEKPLERVTELIASWKVFQFISVINSPVSLCVTQYFRCFLV